MSELKLWHIYAEFKDNEGELFYVEHEDFHEDAGAAWLDFSKRFRGIKWHSISVNEVNINERKGISGAHQGA